ncbi:MAG: hypothetical protein IJO64_05135, partial [Clostridia bacterium]|nr:hypothetical protein [Clostridia bacterium]
LSANLYLYCTLYRVTVVPLMSAIPCTGAFWNDDQSITSTQNYDGDMNYKCTSGMGTVNSYNSMNITQIVKYWKDSYDAARKGLLLYLPDSRDYALYPSSNNTDSSKRPYLTIQYSTINHSVHYEFDDNIPVVLKNKSSSKVMRFYSNSLYQYNEDINDITQQFKIKRHTDGRYVIANHNNYILTVDSTYNMTFSAPPAAGPGVYDNQLWYIVKTEDGYYQIVLYNNQNYCLAATSSADGQLVLATNRSSDLSKWSIDFRNNVLRVFVNSNNIGTPNATVQLFKACDDDSVILTTTNAGGYAFFGNLSATATQYGITASKEGYTRNSYTINNSETPLTFSGGGNGSGSFDVSISISSFANFPLLTYPLSETCKPPSIDLNQQYGWRNRDSGLDFHKGIDISRKSDGTRLGYLSVNNRPDVVSIANGKVVKVHRENTGSAGRYVVVVCDLDSDGKYDIQVRYLHLATIPESITKNAIVCPEQVIGKPGGSGNGRDSGYGVHLHIDISVYVNDSGSSPAVDNTIDPNAFFRQQVINEE